MAVTLSGSTDGYSRTANLPTSIAVTMCGWFYPTSTTPFKMAFWLGNSGDTLFRAIAFANDASVILYGPSGGFDFTTLLGTFSANTWYFVALRCSGSGAGAQVGSIRTVSQTSLTSASLTGSSFTTADLYVGNDPGSEVFAGKVGGVKIWDASLTDDELMVESYYYRAIRRASLNIEAPLFTTSEDEVDYSGNGRNWTVSGSPVTADGPPIIWAPRGSRRAFATVNPTGTSVPVKTFHYGLQRR